jgi:hypothetical protein
MARQQPGQPIAGESRLSLVESRPKSVAASAFVAPSRRACRSISYFTCARQPGAG